MSLIKPLERLRRMHNLIKFRRTGPPEAFAQRLGISQSMLFRLLNELKELGAPIHYCHIHLSYTYYDSVELQLGYVSVPAMTPIPRPPKAAGGQVIPLQSARPTQCHTAGV